MFHGKIKQFITENPKYAKGIMITALAASAFFFTGMVYNAVAANKMSDPNTAGSAHTLIVISSVVNGLVFGAAAIAFGYIMYEMYGTKMGLKKSKAESNVKTI